MTLNELDENKSVKLTLAIVSVLLVIAALPAIISLPIVIYDSFTNLSRINPNLTPCFASAENNEEALVKRDGTPSQCVANALDAAPSTILKAAILQSLWELAVKKTPGMTPVVKDQWKQFAQKSVGGIEWGSDWAVFLFKDVPLLNQAYSKPSAIAIVDSLKTGAFVNKPI